MFAGPSISALIPSFTLHLRAENKSPKTIETYTAAVDLLVGYAERTGMPRQVNALRREHIRPQVS